MSLYVWLVIGVVAAFVLDRFFLYLEDRGLLYWRKKKSSISGISPFLAIDVAFQPGKKYVIEQIEEGQKECSDEEEANGKKR